MGDVVKPKEKRSKADILNMVWIISGVIIILFGLIGLWKWALFSMSNEVANAWGITFAVSILLWLFLPVMIGEQD